MKFSCGEKNNGENLEVVSGNEDELMKNNESETFNVKNKAIGDSLEKTENLIKSNTDSIVFADSVENESKSNDDPNDDEKNISSTEKGESNKSKMIDKTNDLVVSELASTDLEEKEKETVENNSSEDSCYGNEVLMTTDACAVQKKTNSCQKEGVSLDEDENKENEKISYGTATSLAVEEGSNGTSEFEIRSNECQTVPKKKEKRESKRKKDECLCKESEVVDAKKRLSKPMPKSKKLSLLQEEQRQKNLKKQCEPEEVVLDADDGIAVESARLELDVEISSEKKEKIGNEENSSLLAVSKKGAENNNDKKGPKKTKESCLDYSLLTKKRQTDGLSEGLITRAKKKKLEEKKEKLEIEENKDKLDSGSSERNNARGELPYTEPLTCEQLKLDDEKKKSFDSKVLIDLRGALKNLTKNDLEELIVQKLCEVITERSMVGKLRRKAQALEQDQEKWKSKVQVLSKQVKEMELVMKKYMSDVQKQAKDGSSQVIVPLKITRSVGLQVSFLSGGSKIQRSNFAQANVTSNSSQYLNYKTSKPVSVNVAQNSNQTKSGTSSTGQCLPKEVEVEVSVSSGPAMISPSLGQNAKKNSHSRSENVVGDAVSLQPTRQSSSTSLLSKMLHNQIGKSSSKSQESVKHGSGTQVCSQQPQNQNSSKVIDLTDDDDRQAATVAVQPPGVMTLINQSPQSQQLNSRFTYILPAGGATNPTPPNGQNVQVLIASPTIPQANRQQIVSMPPLLFKGGSANQSGPQPVSSVPNTTTRILCPKPLKHPAPLPPQPANLTQKPNLKLLPPRPALKISKVQTGIVLSWNMSLSSEHEPISSYQLYAYQESDSPPATSLWKKVGDVKALPLPMACTLTQFMSGHKYHFAVRAVDQHSRIGPFSFPGTIVLVK